VGVIIREGIHVRRIEVVDGRDIVVIMLGGDHGWMALVGPYRAFGNTEEQDIRFYHHMQRLVEDLRKEGCREILVMGDFNAYIIELDGYEDNKGQSMKNFTNSSLLLLQDLMQNTIGCDDVPPSIQSKKGYENHDDTTWALPDVGYYLLCESL